jgi:hypothetical protein
MMNHTIFVLAALLLAPSAQARTLVVNPALPGASDASVGSETQPLKTISRAAQLVQTGDVVRIHSGVYRESVAIKQSGTKEQPIRFEAAPGADSASAARTAHHPVRPGSARLLAETVL